MPEIENAYFVSTLDTPDELNRVLAMIAERLDRLVGFRGVPRFHSDIDMEGNRLIDVGDGSRDQDASTYGQRPIIPTQELNADDSPTFAGLTLTDLTASRILGLDGDGVLESMDEGASETIAIADDDGVTTHTLTFVDGILTDYSTS